jgi:hypothetical protein
MKNSSIIWFLMTLLPLALTWPPRHEGRLDFGLSVSWKLENGRNVSSYTRRQNDHKKGTVVDRSRSH